MPKPPYEPIDPVNFTAVFEHDALSDTDHDGLGIIIEADQDHTTNHLNDLILAAEQNPDDPAIEKKIEAALSKHDANTKDDFKFVSPLKTHKQELRSWLETKRTLNGHLPENLNGISRSLTISKIPGSFGLYFRNAILKNLEKTGNYWDFRNYQIQQITGKIDENLEILKLLKLKLKEKVKSPDGSEFEIADVSFDDKNNKLTFKRKGADPNNPQEEIELTLEEALKPTNGTPSENEENFLKRCKLLKALFGEDKELKDFNQKLDYLEKIRSMYEGVTIQKSDQPASENSEIYDIKFGDKPIAHIKYTYTNPENTTKKISFTLAPGLSEKEREKAILAIVDQATRYQEINKSNKLEIYGFKNDPATALKTLKLCILNDRDTEIADRTLEAWKEKADNGNKEFANAIKLYKKLKNQATSNRKKLKEEIMEELKIKQKGVSDKPTKSSDPSTPNSSNISKENNIHRGP